MQTPRRAAAGPATEATGVVAAARHAIPAAGFSVSKLALVGVAATMALSGSVAAIATPGPANVPVAFAQPVSTTRSADDTDSISRGADRTPLADAVVPPKPSVTATPSAAATTEAPPAPVATRTLYPTVTVNVRADASADSALVRQLAAGTAVTAVGDAAGDWQRIDLAGAAGYVSAQYLSATPPPSAAATSATPKATSASTSSTKVAAGGSYPACPSGSGVESGLTARAVTLHRAICASFPAITSFGGYRGDGEHADGRALDSMVSGSSGRALAEWARANASALGIQTVIYEQKIWTTQRASEGWRPMADRGSVTANHYDHVHIQVL